MSTPTSPHSGRIDSPVTPTRQQLDELDALLQRMLALPVNHLDDAAEAAPPEPAATATETLAPPAESGPEPWQEPPAPELLPEPTDGVLEVRWRLLETEPAPRPEPPPGELIIIPPPEPAAPSAEALAPAPTNASPAPSPEEPVPPTQFPPAEHAPAAAGPSASPTPSRPVRRPRLPPRSGPLWQRPLVWSNRAFDHTTEGLGLPGVWLRRPAGRAVLGWAGLAFLAAAAALVFLARIGWTW